MDKDTQPIIIGVAQHTWREQDTTRTPVDALQAVASSALSDSGSEQVKAAVDALVHVPFILNQVPELKTAMPVNPGAALAARLGLRSKQYTGDVGGNLPQQLLGEFAGRVLRGEHQVVLLCGAEMLASFLGAVRAGAGFPDWNTGETDTAESLTNTPLMTAASERTHGLFEPVNAYPLFESALRHARGLDGDAHRERLGQLISSMSEVAAGNPHAWNRNVYSPEQVLDAQPGNRMISYPYTKLMNAILAVDQAAAVVLTTVGKARAMGVDKDRWIYLRGAAIAHDSWYLSEREFLHRSPALQAAAECAIAQSAIGLEEFTHFDLYSCFPSAVQVACDSIGLDLADPRGVTVTGGVTLFGGAGNNYSMHAIAEMVERLRATERGAGLVTASGGYLTKHAVGAYSREAPATAWTPVDSEPLQTKVNQREGPQLAVVGEGSLQIDAHTVHYSREGPRSGIVVGTLADGRRCVAVSSDASIMAQLIAHDCVGLQGAVSHKEGTNQLQL
ncbi:MAG: acetyl-CoA acetyltransferase [Congregibacter sp.]